jgi:transcriptional regulator with XRE-family HTH domain
LARHAREMFPANLKRLLAERNMRPSALAKAVGVDPSAVTAWKDGGSITLDNLQKIADVFGVPLRVLIEDPEDPKTMGIDVETALRVVAGAALKSLKTQKDS